MFKLQILKTEATVPFSPEGVPRTAHKARDCHGPSGLAMTFRAAFLRNMSVWVVLLILHIFCPATAQAYAETSPAGQAALKGGFAKVNITPPPGITLIGSKGKPSDDIIDELYAKALVLSDGNTTIAIVSADLLYTPVEARYIRFKVTAERTLTVSEVQVLDWIWHTPFDLRIALGDEG